MVNGTVIVGIPMELSTPCAFDTCGDGARRVILVESSRIPHFFIRPTSFSPKIRHRNRNQLETDMSADKDRGIRRQKQKRAKDLKKQRRQPAPAGVASRASSRPSEPKIT
jgi:hypothetical protein